MTSPAKTNLSLGASYPGQGERGEIANACRVSSLGVPSAGVGTCHSPPGNLRTTGCRGFIGPVPPPLSMSAVRSLPSGTAKQLLQHDHKGIAIPTSLRPVRKETY